MRKMRNRFLSWFPRANRSAFVFRDKGVSWGGKKVFPEGQRTDEGLIKDLGLGGAFPLQLLENTRGRYSVPENKADGFQC